MEHRAGCRKYPSAERARVSRMMHDTAKPTPIYSGRINDCPHCIKYLAGRSPGYLKMRGSIAARHKFRYRQAVSHHTPFSEVDRGGAVAAQPLLNLRPINQANSYKFVTHENVRGIASLSAESFLCSFNPLSRFVLPPVTLLHSFPLSWPDVRSSPTRIHVRTDARTLAHARTPFLNCSASVRAFTLLLLSTPTAIRFQPYLRERLGGSARSRPPSRRVYDRLPRAFLSVA